MERRHFLRRGALATLAACAPSPDFAEKAPVAAPRVVRRGMADYDSECQLANPRFTIAPREIVVCQNAGQVAQTLRRGRAARLPLRPRSGRHCYEGYSSVDDGIVLDVEALRDIQFNPIAKTVRVGAGVRLIDLYEALWPQRVTVPAGSCATVGIAGLTLGGGYGLLARHFGLTCDNLLAVEMVTADGRILEADHTRHADLFWACRGGGGGNFGVATSFVFQTHPIDAVSTYQATWDAYDLETVVRVWQAWAPTADDRLTSLLKLHARQRGAVVSTGLFAGTAADLEAVLKPLRAAGSPYSVVVREMPYIEAARAFAGLPATGAPIPYPPGGFDPRTCFKGSSDFADRPLTPGALSTLRKFLESAPANGDLIQLENFGGAIGRVPPRATAFPHRGGTLFGLQYQAYWSISESEVPGLAWVRELRKAMQPFVSGRAYCNYCDSNIIDWPRAYYGVNLERLLRVKAHYDPTNFFRFPQSIPLPSRLTL